MSLRSPADWQILITEHQQSGQSAAEFCREHKLCSKNFNKRRKELLLKTTTQNTSSFVPVTMSTQNQVPMLECHTDRTVIKIPLSVSATWLAAFIQQLQS
ncbi:MAG: hypothetical protein ACC657_17210 [Thiohalomonadales bacterium]